MKKIVFILLIIFAGSIYASENGLRAYLVDLERFDEIADSKNQNLLNSIINGNPDSKNWLSEDGLNQTNSEISELIRNYSDDTKVSVFALWRMIESLSTKSYPLIGMPTLDFGVLSTYFKQAGAPNTASLFSNIYSGDSQTITKRFEIYDIYVLTLYAPSDEELEKTLNETETAIKLGKELVRMTKSAKKHLVEIETQKRLTYCEEYSCTEEEKTEAVSLDGIEESAIKNAYRYTQAMEEYLDNAKELKKWIKAALKSKDSIVFVYHEV